MADGDHEDDEADSGERVPIGCVSGYTHLVRRPAYVAMEGEGAWLEVGAIIELRSDQHGCSRAFAPGRHVVVVGFQPPFSHGCTDYVVLASDGTCVAEVKPSQVERVVMGAPRALRNIA